MKHKLYSQKPKTETDNQVKCERKWAASEGGALMCVCTHKQTNTNIHSYRHRKPQQISAEWANKYVH